MAELPKMLHESLDELLEAAGRGARRAARSARSTRAKRTSDLPAEAPGDAATEMAEAAPDQAAEVPGTSSQPAPPAGEMRSTG
jgi:hypothetical protein